MNMENLNYFFKSRTFPLIFITTCKSFDLKKKHIYNTIVLD